MIDNACFVIKDFSNEEFNRLTERLDQNCPINADNIHFNLHNVRVRYFPNVNKLVIKNSLHCLFNREFSLLKQAVNYNDFSFFDFQVISVYLSEIIFERPLENFQLSTNFEVGLNVQLDGISPFDLISRYMSYGSTVINEFFTVPPHNLKGKPIERMCFMSDYKLKLYDKSKQSDLRKRELLRYEIVFSELRKIRQVLGIGISDQLNLSTLNEPEVWNTFFNNLIHTYDSIRKIPLIKEQITMNDIAEIHGYCNKIMSDDIKNTMGIHSFKKRRSQMRRTYEQHNMRPDNYHLVVRNKLIAKYNSLINLPQFQGL